MRDFVRVDVSACLMGAFLLLTLPLNWLLSALAAAAFHELCHGAAILLLGGRIWGVRIGAGGAVMETEPLSSGKELVCALAGPAGTSSARGLPWRCMAAMTSSQGSMPESQ